MDDKPLRNNRGQFVPGHKPINVESQRRKPGEPIIPHKNDPTRDGKGRLLYGPPKSVNTKPLMTELRRSFLEAVTPEQLHEALNLLLELTRPGDHGPEVQLKAIDLYLTRVLGRPMQEVQVQNETLQANLNFNLRALCDDDLRQLDTILARTLPQPDPGPDPEVSG